MSRGIVCVVRCTLSRASRDFIQTPSAAQRIHNTLSSTETRSSPERDEFDFVRVGYRFKNLRNPILDLGPNGPWHAGAILALQAESWIVANPCSDLATGIRSRRDGRSSAPDPDAA
eukprot:scaffold15193_cov70-Phaeocystis_antarctica.AAC.4